MVSGTQGKRERNRQRWLERIVAWERSGLSQRAFVEQQRLNAGSFQRWKRIYRNERSAGNAREARAGSVGLVSVAIRSEAVASDSGVILQLERTMQIRLERNFDAGTLERVLQVICGDGNGQ